MKLLYTCLFVFTCWTIHAQAVAINNDGTPPDSSSILDISSSNHGVLFPRVTAAQRSGIANPATGLLVYQTDGRNGFWYFDGMNWIDISSIEIEISDADGDTKIEVESNPDDDTIRFIANGTEYFRMADSASFEVVNTGGSIFIGEDAGRADDFSDNENVLIGTRAGYSNTAGNKNTFIGFEAGYKNVGSSDGGDSPGNRNTYLGYRAGYDNVTGFDNCLVGFWAGSNNTGERNTFLGAYSGAANTTGDRNTFIGTAAGQESSTGDDNLAMGFWAGRDVTGSKNIILGNLAGYSVNANNVIVGHNAGRFASGSSNVLIGHSAGYTSSGGNKLFIENTSSNSPLIYGEFDNDVVGINGSLGVGTESPGVKLHVYDGNIRADNGTTEDEITRALSLKGARKGNGGAGAQQPYARINFENIDTSLTPTQNYTGASISSENPFYGAGNLKFYTKGYGTTLSQKMEISDANAIIIGDPDDNTFQGRLILAGARSNDLFPYCYMDFDNWSGTDYTGARIASYGLQSPSSADLRFYTRNNGSLDFHTILDSDGNFGIGTETPTEKLVVGTDLGSALSGTRVTIGDPGNVSGLNVGENIDNRGWFLWNNSSNVLELGTRASGAQYSATLVLNDGEVGIGTSTPDAKLHVYGGNAAITRGGQDQGLTRTVKIGGARNASGSAYASLDFQNYDSNTGGVDYVGARIASENNGGGDDGDLRFYTGLNTALNLRMFISHHGDVGVGTSSPASKLSVAGDITPGSDNLYDLGSATNRWDNVWATNAIIQTSDRREKKEIAPLDYGLTEVMEMLPVSYYWRSGSDRKNLGLIAQDIREIIPEVVAEDNPDKLGIRYQELIPVLIRAIQEQQVMIEELKEQLAVGLND